MPHSSQTFDLIFRNAHVVDPSQEIDGIADVGIQSGRIAAVRKELDDRGCPDVRDARGTYICAGLVDLHGHWYEGSLYGINADIGLNHGVTTAVDAGTAGFANFPDFRKNTIDHAHTRVLGFVHVSFMGLHAPFAEELLELRYARPIETSLVIEKHRDVAIGVKVRIGSMTASHGNTALDLALGAAAAARVPLMTHISAGADEHYVLEHLRPGDILTHCFHGRSNGMLADNPEGFIPQLRFARERGVIFDVGHGCGSFSWDTAQRAFEHFFWPDTISTDLHRYSVSDPWCVTLPGVMSKFLALGMSLNDVVLKTTIIPARVLKRENDMGSLRPGAVADLFQFRLKEGDFSFRDTHGAVRRSARCVEPVATVRAGVTYKTGQVKVELRQLYPCDQAVFDAGRSTL